MLVQRLKFQNDLALARDFARELAAFVEPCYSRLPDMIVSVPLHPRRLAERGYNQAHALARWTGRMLHVAVDQRAAKRTRMSTAQSMQATRGARGRNLHGAFSGTGRVTDKHVAILDDVLTTTATAAALARALLDDGAQRVDVWACARTPRGGLGAASGNRPS